MNKKNKTQKSNIFITDEFAYETIKEHETENIKEDNKCDCKIECKNCKCKGE